jgi:hypothetical protein
MASRHLQGIEGENYAPVAPLLHLPRDERREWLTRLLGATEKALADLGDSASFQFGTMVDDLAALRDRLEAELATVGSDECAGGSMPRVVPGKAGERGQVCL